MRDQLLEELAQFDKKRIALMEQVSRLDAKRLQSRRRPNQWSIQEIVEHLVIGEDYVLKGLPGIGLLIATEQDMESRISYAVALLVLKTRFPVNVPAPEMVPQGKLSLPELRRQWDESQEYMCHYVNSIDPARYTEAVFAHPLTGPLTIVQVIKIRDLHFALHNSQIQKRIAGR